MPLFTDQLNRQVELAKTPARIISVVPSQTELLFYLGLDDEIIGITKFCIHPAAKIKNKIKVGGTKQLNIELIRELKPDLIIANKEENERAQVEELMAICPVWISDINNISDALAMIKYVGAMVGRDNESKILAEIISAKFSRLQRSTLNLKVAYLIWRKPYMAAGKGTFIDNMLQLCGFSNVFNIERYPEVDNDMIRGTDPDVVMLSSEPYPFKNKHIEELKTIVPKAKIILVDGEMFSWYGSRLLLAADYFTSVVKLLAAKEQ